MTYYWTPFLWVRWVMGKVGLWEDYDNLILDLKASHLEKAAKDLPVEMIVTDSTFAFEEVKQAFERLNTGKFTSAMSSHPYLDSSCTDNESRSGTWKGDCESGGVKASHAIMEPRRIKY